MNDLNHRNLMGLAWYTHGNQKRVVIRSHSERDWKCKKVRWTIRAAGAVSISRYLAAKEKSPEPCWREASGWVSPRAEVQASRADMICLIMNVVPSQGHLFFFFFFNSGQEAAGEKIHNPGFPELTLGNRNRERLSAQTLPVGPFINVQGRGNPFPIVLKCTVIISAFSHWGKNSPRHDSPSLVCSTYLFIWGAEYSNLCFPLLTA